MTKKKYQGRPAAHLRAAVRRGIALLEEKLPGMWRQLLAVKTFDFADPCCCVVGTIGQCQLSGNSSDNWTRGKMALGVVADPLSTGCVGSPKYYGFDWHQRDEQPRLAAYWKKAIEGKRV